MSLMQENKTVVGFALHADRLWAKSKLTHPALFTRGSFFFLRDFKCESPGKLVWRKMLN